MISAHFQRPDVYKHYDGSRDVQIDAKCLYFVICYTKKKNANTLENAQFGLQV